MNFRITLLFFVLTTTGVSQSTTAADPVWQTKAEKAAARKKAEEEAAAAKAKAEAEAKARAEQQALEQMRAKQKAIAERKAEKQRQADTPADIYDRPAMVIKHENSIVASREPDHRLYTPGWWRTYTATSDDTQGKIAAAYKMEFDEFQKANPILTKEPLKIGQMVWIWDPSAPAKGAGFFRN